MEENPQVRRRTTMAVVLALASFLAATVGGSLKTKRRRGVATRPTDMQYRGRGSVRNRESTE